MSRLSRYLPTSSHARGRALARTLAFVGGSLLAAACAQAPATDEDLASEFDSGAVAPSYGNDAGTAPGSTGVDAYVPPATGVYVPGSGIVTDAGRPTSSTTPKDAGGDPLSGLIGGFAGALGGLFGPPKDAGTSTATDAGASDAGN